MKLKNTGYLTTYCCSRILSGLLLTSSAVYSQVDNTGFVDPFIGTGGHGHTYPGATTPFGMVQLSPDTRIDGSWDGCGGYHHSDSIIYGFSHTHLNGTGVSDYGDILLMPMAGEPSLDNKIYSSKFSHTDEKASPGFYSVMLKDESIFAELAASARVGMHRYTFPKDGTVSIVLDLLHRDKLLEGSIRRVNNTTYEGIRSSEAWARDQRVYYRIEFSQSVTDSYIERSNGSDQKAWFRFNLDKNENLLVKVSISGVSEAGAGKNMLAEIPHWDFEKVKKEAHDAWQKELGKIDVSGGTKEQSKIFYSALYHCFLQPNIYSDVDGQYRGRDMKIHKAEGFNYYTVFSLWDTFRAWHPLMTIIDRRRTVDFIKTFLVQYEQGGLLPVWELSSNETECMIGYHAVSIMADAMTKGIQGFDYGKAFEAMKKSAESRSRFGLGAYIDYGCLSMDDENESVSKTLEYAYDDWCIAQVAALLNKDADYKTYSDRAQYWKNLYDPETKFLRPRKNGGWYEPFDPHEVNNNYTEANAWQYTFFVPHEITTLKEKLGGDAEFEKKLDELFTTESQTTGREQSDITGLIGQYAHGNEPSHHMAYLYNYIGKPWKTQERVHQVLTNFYHAAPDGLIGNEDCGQMSAWYVLSAMGLYQVCPGYREFDIVPPLFREIKIHLGNGKAFQITSSGEAKNNSYIKYISNSGKEKYSNTVISYNDISAGVKLDYTLGEYSAPGKVQQNAIAGHFGGQGILNPVTEIPQVHSATSFKINHCISITSNYLSDEIYYTLDSSDPDKFSRLYSSPVCVDTSGILKAIAISKEGIPSKAVAAHFYKMLHPDWKIKIHSQYSNQYTAGGEDGIIDGIRGDANWKKGNWQGYQGQDFECVIDLGKEQTVSDVGAGFLQDTRSWILMPLQAEFSLSTDSIHFSEPVVIKNTVDPKDNTEQVKDFSATIAPAKARYVKVKALNFGKLPEWHQGHPYDGDAYIFVDEILVK